MATPAIEAMGLSDAANRFTFVGSYVAIEALKHHPQCEHAYVDETKQQGNRLLNTYRFAKRLGKHDIAISFRNQIHANLLMLWSKTPKRIVRASRHAFFLATASVPLNRREHLVLQYHELAMHAMSELPQPGPLRLYIDAFQSNRALLGVNPGATYGSAKRWYPEKFAEAAAAFASDFDIVIFGGPNEVEMAQEIERHLKRLHRNNVLNLAGTTSIESLCAHIGSLSLFITNDSGPMHIAAAYHVPTVAIFGPTRHKETSQWMNPKGVIVRHEMECAPCMKRECPLKHHECMRSITSHEVIEAAAALIN